MNMYWSGAKGKKEEDRINRVAQSWKPAPVTKWSGEIIGQ